MNIKNYVLIASGLTFSQMILVNDAKAQKEIKLDSVVISTTKNDQKQSQTGKVVTIIGSDVLGRSHGKNLTDLLNEQAGIVVGGATGNAGLNKSLFVRGAGSAYAVVLIDGILVNNPAGAAFDLRMISIDQVERIEILKGGQSTIYGSDAVAGVINIITKKGGKDGNSVYGVASYGSYKTYKGTVGISSKVDDFSYNVAYTQGKTDGISEAATPEGSTSVFDKDGNKTGAVNANFSLQATKNLSISPFLRYFYGHYDFDSGAFKDSPTNNFKLKHFNGGFNTKYEFATGKINLNYSYEDSQLDSKGDYGTSLSEGKLNFIDLFYNQKIGSKLDVLVGLDNRATKFRLNANQQPSTNLFSTYASVFMHDLSIFNLEVGGRYNKHKQYGENSTFNITPSINIIKALKLFGTYSTAFKAPTLENLFGAYGANLNLTPEKSKNYEAGFNLSFADDRYSLRVAGFKRDLTNAIVYGNIGYINQADQKAKGVEVEPAVQIGILHLKGYYAYVEGTEFNFVTNAVSDYLLRRPKNIVGVNAGVQATKALYVSANFKYNGKRQDGDFTNYKVVDLASYKLLDFYAEYAVAKNRVKFFADLKNILNEKYTEFYGYNSMGFNMNAGISFNIH
ncbi:TonB-dependent receptor plug domain-containing protein [Pedobacter sp.]|jgi:vitamin B12 transporter|uniref:TonB-dependent receptor plug domain-containing protein n=1 Tax=Pedobacter sp. TaxID=1411316 RepID=UPI002BBFB829|nr:TonB-dependent receptor [Pedobacter sp.]HWW39844.1 TonB-dependent receptor [Pedobacter sp.]